MTFLKLKGPMAEPDAVQKNELAWDSIASSEQDWFPVVDIEQMARARSGQLKIHVTAQKSIPTDWLEPLEGRTILCLAGGGGQQAPLLAAAGGQVTVFDLSRRQLERDQEVADRESLQLRTVQGDMRDLSIFPSESFDLIINPCSVCYCPDVLPIWRECYRVTRPGGSLITGLINPINFLFDEIKAAQGDFRVAHPIPYSDLDLSPEQRETILGQQRPVRFGHRLADMLGGLPQVGFQIDGLYEDCWGAGDKLSELIDLFLAVRATRPG